MTDFVGWLPMPDGGDREHDLTSDYNAEMIEQIARFPSLRDRLRLRRQPRRRGTGHLRRRAAADPRVGRAELPVLRLRLRACRPTNSPTGRRSAPSWATGPASRSAWSRSAAPGWAPTCSAGWWRPSRRRSRLVPGLRMIVVAGPRIDPGLPPVPGRAGGARLRARPVPASRGLRSGGRAGWPDHHDGAHRGPAAVHLRAAAPPLRAELPRPAPAGPVRRRAAAWTTRETAPDVLAEAMAEEISRPVRYRPGRDRRGGAGRRLPGRAHLTPSSSDPSVDWASRRTCGIPCSRARSRAPQQYGSGPVAVAEPDESLPVHGQRRGQGWRPRHPLGQRDQRRQDQRGRARDRLARARPGPGSRYASSPSSHAPPTGMLACSSSRSASGQDRPGNRWRRASGAAQRS